MENNIIISICIPTYNRVNYLVANVEKIIPQLEKHKGRIELIISDNFSTDNTFDTLNKINNASGDSFTLIRQKEHLENADDHFARVVGMAKGKYVHLLGDDDILSPNFYDVVLELTSSNYGMIFFNRLAGDKDCSNNIVYDPTYLNTIQEDDTKEFAKKLLSQCGFMSSLVFRKDCWIAGSDYARKEYYGYEWLGRIYAGAIILNTTSCYYYIPMLIMRSPKRAWSKYWMQYWFIGLSNIFRDLDKLVPGILDSWLHVLHDKRKNYYISGLFLAITEHKDYYKNLKSEMWPYLNKRQKIVYNLFLQLRPALIFNYAYRGYCKYKRILFK